MSFAQFQADQSVVGKARRVRELDGALQGFREAMQCDRGDFREYAGLREKLSRNEKNASQTARKATREATVAQLSQLRRGDIVRILGGRRAGVAVVIASDDDPKTPRPTVVTDAGRVTRLSIADLTMGLNAAGRLDYPRKVQRKGSSSTEGAWRSGGG